MRISKVRIPPRPPAAARAYSKPALKRNESEERDREFGKMVELEYFFAVLPSPKLVRGGRGSNGGGGKGTTMLPCRRTDGSGIATLAISLLAAVAVGRRAMLYHSTGFVAALCLDFFWPVIKSYVDHARARQREEGRKTGWAIGEFSLIDITD